MGCQMLIVLGQELISTAKMKLIVFSLLVAYAMAAPGPAPMPRPDADPKADPAVLYSSYYGYPYYYGHYGYYGWPYYGGYYYGKRSAEAEPHMMAKGALRPDLTLKLMPSLTPMLKPGTTTVLTDTGHIGITTDTTDIGTESKKFSKPRTAPTDNEQKKPRAPHKKIQNNIFLKKRKSI